MNTVLAANNAPPPKVACCLSALIITKNEENNIGPCLDSLAGWCDDIHVVDSFSTDRTLEIARRYTTKIYQHVFEGHARQRTWAFQSLPFHNEWVIALDADQRVTPQLSSELLERFSASPGEVRGFFVRRRQVFRGRWIRFGGYYPKYMLKVVHRPSARLDEHEFDDRFYVNGATAKLKHDIIEANENESRISFFVDKHVKYASQVAAEELQRRSGELRYLINVTPFGNPDQRALWLKTIWWRLPLYLRPFLLFVYRYFLRLGFLDGKEGFVFHFLQSFWFRLLVDTRIEEMLAEEARHHS